MVDVDHFKMINDNYGHPQGDEVLRVLANCLVRTAPRRGDFVARYGGEEFAVVLGDTPLDGATLVARRIVEAVRRLTIDLDAESLTITVSVGIAQLDADEQLATWLARADQGLYQAKQQGRNRWVALSTSS